MTSTDIEIGLIRIDRTPPTVVVGAVPDLDTWLNAPLDVSLEGLDQLDLSGMAAAPVDRPLEAGAYVGYRLDEAPVQQVRGAQAAFTVAGDGQHVVALEGADVAGNLAEEQLIHFKIDQTPPTGAFHLPDPADPRQVAVGVSDATSGIRDGYVAYRRAGEKLFTRLPTGLKGERLVARLNDLAMPAGNYEFRAIANDEAGNQAVITRRVDGAPMALSAPVRRVSRMGLATSRTIRKCLKAKKKRRAGSRKRLVRKCSKREVSSPAGAPLRLPNGKGLRSSGRVTSIDGVPLAGANVVVEHRPRSGGRFARLGVVRTDQQGAFRFTVPGGPSQTIRYRYEGNNTVRPAQADLMTKVNAAAVLRVNHRRLRNGQAVRFAGRLLGKPIPADGKIVALQAKVGRAWRTFATPRANAKGVFRHRYRFTKTTGLRRYAFRALVTREAAYPYERGASRTVSVTVRGR